MPATTAHLRECIRTKSRCKKFSVNSYKDWRIIWAEFGCGLLSVIGGVTFESSRCDDQILVSSIDQQEPQTYSMYRARLRSWEGGENPLSSITLSHLNFLEASFDSDQTYL